MERDPLAKVLSTSYLGGIALQSQFFRTNARQVARAASLGFITSRLPNGLYGNLWRPTVSGLQYLNDNPYIESETDEDSL